MQQKKYFYAAKKVFVMQQKVFVMQQKKKYLLGRRDRGGGRSDGQKTGC